MENLVYLFAVYIYIIVMTIILINNIFLKIFGVIAAGWSFVLWPLWITVLLIMGIVARASFMICHERKEIRRKKGYDDYV